MSKTLTTSSPPSPPSPPSPAPSSPDPPKICTSKDAQATNLLGAIGGSLLAITGLGSLFPIPNSLQKLQDQITAENAKTQDLVNAGSAAFAKMQGSINKDIIQDFMLINLSLNAHMDLNKTILDEKILLNKVYITSSFVLILLLLIWNYIT